MPATKKKTAPKAAATKATTTLVGTSSAKPKAKAKGKATITIDYESAAIAYTKTKTSAAENLIIFRDIGLVLLAVKKQFPSKPKFGKHIATTPLSIMSKQDRNDAMWLAENWKSIQTFKAENDIASNSVGILRKAKAKSDKAAKEPKATNPPKLLDIVQLGELVQKLCKENGHTELALIRALQSVNPSK
tara:strand:+ start:258 stop:824 length:567 start_codon:yes stop_codon:yes gene_type:complete